MIRAVACMAALAAAAVVTGNAAAAPRLSYDTQSSSNWAGYAVSAATDAMTPLAFTSVSGSWRAPRATCTAGSASYAAFWVGLGGFSETSQALEQVGTDSDCTASGKATYSAWYELVPAAAVPIKLVVGPGDKLTATVTVRGTRVTLRISNVTRKKTFAKTLAMASPDVSSAEWIAEAPSACDDRGDCRPLSLANFGTVAFSSAKATANGHTGTISDLAWNATAIDLYPDGGFGGRFGAAASPASALPSALSPAGNGFLVAWSDASAAPSAGSQVGG